MATSSMSRPLLLTAWLPPDGDSALREKLGEICDREFNVIEKIESIDLDLDDESGQWNVIVFSNLKDHQAARLALKDDIEIRDYPTECFPEVTASLGVHYVSLLKNHKVSDELQSLCGLHVTPTSTALAGRWFQLARARRVLRRALVDAEKEAIKAKQQENIQKQSAKDKHTSRGDPMLSVDDEIGDSNITDNDTKITENDTEIIATDTKIIDTDANIIDTNMIDAVHVDMAGADNSSSQPGKSRVTYAANVKSKVTYADDIENRVTYSDDVNPQVTFAESVKSRVTHSDAAEEVSPGNGDDLKPGDRGYETADDEMESTITLSQENWIYMSAICRKQLTTLERKFGIQLNVSSTADGACKLTMVSVQQSHEALMSAQMALLSLIDSCEESLGGQTYTPDEAYIHQVATMQDDTDDEDDKFRHPDMPGTWYSSRHSSGVDDLGASGEWQGTSPKEPDVFKHPDIPHNWYSAPPKSKIAARKSSTMEILRQESLSNTLSENSTLSSPYNREQVRSNSYNGLNESSDRDVGHGGAISKQPRASPDHECIWGFVNTKNNQAIIICKVDITQLAVDAIVNAANSELHHASGVGKAVSLAAGPQLQEACNEVFRKKGSLPSKKVIVTKGFNLPCREVYHAISPKYDDFKLIMKNWRAKNAIVETVEKCLKKAEKHKLSNIAIPAISSGGCHVPENTVAESIVSAITNFCKSPTTLKDIYLVDINTSILIGINDVLNKNDCFEQLPPSAAVRLVKDIAVTERGSSQGKNHGQCFITSRPGNMKEHMKRNRANSSPMRPVSPMITLDRPEDIERSSRGHAEGDVLRAEPQVDYDFISTLEKSASERTIKNSDGEDTPVRGSPRGHGSPRGDRSPGGHASPNEETSPRGQRSLKGQRSPGGDLSVKGMSTYGYHSSGSEGEDKADDGKAGSVGAWEDGNKVIARSGSYDKAMGDAASAIHPLLPGYQGEKARDGSPVRGKSGSPANNRRGSPRDRSSSPPGNQLHPSGASETVRDRSVCPSGNQLHPSGASQTVRDRSVCPSGDQLHPSGASQTVRDRSVCPSGDQLHPSGASQTVRDRSVCPSGDQLHPSGASQTVRDRSVSPPGKSEIVSGGSKKSKDKLDPCAICLEECQSPKTLSKCHHTFCKECLDTAFTHKPVCPVCSVVYGVITGTQPVDGDMDITKERSSLPGYPGHGTIVIHYKFASGHQGSEHPHPGKRYSGIHRTAYLPDNTEGRHICKLLGQAFEARLTFTIGRSATTGLEGQVTWNDIHHKTNKHGGPTSFGYPDDTYLERLKDELASKGFQ